MNFKSYSEKESKSKKHTQKWVIRGWASPAWLRLKYTDLRDVDMKSYDKIVTEICDAINAEIENAKRDESKHFYLDDYIAVLTNEKRNVKYFVPNGDWDALLKTFKDNEGFLKAFGNFPQTSKGDILAAKFLIKLGEEKLPQKYSGEKKMNGHRTRAPAKKHSPAVKVNVRKMF